MIRVKKYYEITDVKLGLICLLFGGIHIAVINNCSPVQNKEIWLKLRNCNDKSVVTNTFLEPYNQICLFGLDS